MKKVNPLAIVLLVLIFVVLLSTPGFVIAVVWSSRFDMAILAWVVLIPFAFMFIPVYMNPCLYPIAKKTMERGLGRENFVRPLMHTNKDTGTFGSILCIDESSGRVAYVPILNPGKFYLIHARELTHLKSSLNRGPLGGTRYVYFEFFYKNKRYRFPTLTSKNMYFIESTQVKNALAKGDKFCSAIRKWQDDTVA